MIENFSLWHYLGFTIITIFCLSGGVLSIGFSVVLVLTHLNKQVAKYEPIKIAKDHEDVEEI